MFVEIMRENLRGGVRGAVVEAVGLGGGGELCGGSGVAGLSVVRVLGIGGGVGALHLNSAVVRGGRTVGWSCGVDLKWSPCRGKVLVGGGGLEGGGPAGLEWAGVVVNTGKSACWGGVRISGYCAL
jgi:hypothetical protein